jgi:carboxypeptidase C (cathepsin A)
MAILFTRGIPTLVYNGECDMVCNWIGSQQWVENLVWAGQPAINGAVNTTWTVAGAPVGWYRSALNVTLLVVANAGHMSPFDQPKNVYQMVRAFIQKQPWNS